MKKLVFKKDIKASAQNVYEIMLGIHNKSTYEFWTTIFNPTSSYEGNWDVGSKMRFVGIDENGKKAGMVSEVLENEIAKHVSVRHYGFLDGENEITSGEQVEKWAGGLEEYTYSEKNGTTTVVVELDTIDDFLSYFDEKYPKALDRLKELCESQS